MSATPSAESDAGLYGENGEPLQTSPLRAAPGYFEPTARRHECKPPRYAEDYTLWRCPNCGAEWTANEDDGWCVTPPGGQS